MKRRLIDTNQPNQPTKKQPPKVPASMLSEIEGIQYVLGDVKVGATIAKLLKAGILAFKERGLDAFASPQ